MKTTTFAAILSLFAFAQAQVSYDPTTGVFSCPIANGAYCAGASLATNIIIRCTNGTGQPGNCNDNLAGVPPVGVKPFAPCYQTSEVAGDANCSFNGTVYPSNGSAPFPVLGTGGTGGGSSSSAASSAPSASASSVLPSASSNAPGTMSSGVVTVGPYPSASGNATVPVTSPHTSATATGSAQPPVYTGGAAQAVGVAGLKGLALAGAAMLVL